jgi:high affinity sulfate transporter 1
VAGVSVAAVAVPVGIAYAQLAGLPPVVGLYSCILPPVAYALLGSSRQLILNPDSAACAIVAATIMPLAAVGSAHYADLSVVLALLAGGLCMLAGVARLGAIADFLSRPILTGYLNGIALSIIAGQLGRLFGFAVPPAGFFRTLAGFATRLGQTHVPTLLTGLLLFVLIRVLRRVAPRVPAPLVATALAIGAAYVLRLDRSGVALVGAVPAGFPIPHVPAVSASEMVPLLLGACSTVIVIFCSMMMTSRGFAAKNGYVVDANRDFVALGLGNLASGFSQGFVISGADSRTAVADASGGKTQVTSLVAAATMAAVLIFLTGPLAFLPTPVLAAILISSALGLFDVASLRRYWRQSRAEFRHSIVAMLGVMTVGVLPGIGVAVGMAIVRLLLLASRPPDAVLGVVEGRDGCHAIAEEPDARTIPGLIMYRFDAAILFFNAQRFEDRARALVAAADVKPEWFLFDAESVPMLDVTGAMALDSLQRELAGQGVVLAIARARPPVRMMLERCGLLGRIGKERLFPFVRDGVRAFRECHGAA